MVETALSSRGNPRWLVTAWRRGMFGGRAQWYAV